MVVTLGLTQGTIVGCVVWSSVLRFFCAGSFCRGCGNIWAFCFIRRCLCIGWAGSTGVASWVGSVGGVIGTELGGGFCVNSGTGEGTGYCCSLSGWVVSTCADSASCHSSRCTGLRGRGGLLSSCWLSDLCGGNSIDNHRAKIVFIGFPFCCSPHIIGRAALLLTATPNQKSRLRMWRWWILPFSWACRKTGGNKSHFQHKLCHFMKKLVLTPSVWKALAEGEYSPKYDHSVSSIFWTAAKPSLSNFKVLRTCLFVIFEISNCCKSSTAFVWGSTSAIRMYSCGFLLMSQCRRLSEIGTGMILSSVGSKRCDTSEEVFRLWLDRIANRLAWIGF